MRDKQIEDMAMLICKSTNPNMEKPCSECVFNRMCDIQDGCEALIENGYRKASDVAKEIFEEIEKILDKKFSINHGIVLISKEVFAELKKKYESEGEG